MRSIHARLTLRLLLGGALLLGLAALMLHWQVHRALTTEFDASLRATAQTLATLIEQIRGKVKLEFTPENMPQFERERGSEIFLIRTVDGREIKRSRSLGDARFPMRAGSPAAPEAFDISLSDGRIMRCASLRFTPQQGDEDEDDHDSEKPHPSKIDVILVIGRDRAPLDKTLSALQASLGLVGLGALAMLAVLVRWGVRDGLVPLDQLGESVARVNAASLATRFAVAPLPSELRPIAERLNELLARLETAFARERRFTSTAAHELRTPIAELRALAEVNLTTPATESERLESWRDALASTLRMETLALRLLELARAEDPARAVQCEPVLLVDAVAAAWQPCAVRAAERGITFSGDLPTDLALQTDSALLGVILANLCANAVEHAPAGTPFHISSTARAGVVTLLFHNRAEGLSEDNVAHLFERFWRKDTARADARHHGLGLTLAAECAELLGGSLSARLLANGDLEFALQLPKVC